MSEKQAKITNTAKPENITYTIGFSGSIEAQEAHGQTELVNSEQLPIKMSSYGGDSKEALEKIGVVVQQRSEGDDLFYDVVLPDGCELVGTDHSMWSRLKLNGSERATIFYKAAFYDRDAFINFVTRFKIEYHNDNNNRYRSVVDSETGNTLFKSAKDDGSGFDHGTSDCKEWLNQKFPKWDDPFEYWGQEIYVKS